MKLNELKPCPFCGGAVTLIRYGESYRIVCMRCPASIEMTIMADANTLVGFYNRRVNDGT